jgi:dihydrofolate synthase / folylpolyglutamate synthase
MPPPSATATLRDWLAYLELLHPKTIALGLERVREVGARMGLGFSCPVITVGGTNGKGSTAAMLERILHGAGYRAGCYTSPHLLRFNERVRIATVEASDSELIAALNEVEAARGTTPLTYFEFTTLAAVRLFANSGIDVAVLEVGLGGRLDAVNAFDPDCAVLTNVALDHQDYLGPDRESIGREKAGIFRAGRPAICADPEPPASVLSTARNLGADLRLLGRDFGFDADRSQWSWWGRDAKRTGLAFPAMRGANQLVNAAAAIAALESVAARLPVSVQEIRDGLARATLPGRFEVLPGRPTVVLDVAHNPHAAAVLASNLASQGHFARTIGVFGMLADKDIAGVVQTLSQRIDVWHCGSLPGARGTAAETLLQILAASGIAPARGHADIAAAFAAARGEAGENDRIIVFGSFLTVAEVAKLIAPGRDIARTESLAAGAVTSRREHGR